MPALAEAKTKLDPATLRLRPHDLFANQWLLLASGDFATGHHNCMTIAWGSIGTMWSKPFVQVVVRPQRHTFGFMEKYPSFTVSAFRRAFRPALAHLGAKSGRAGDKLAGSGLTPQPSSVVAAPSFAESELTLECEKLYWQDVDPRGFASPEIKGNYAAGDYHRVYFGEIVAVYATAAYAQ